MEVSEVLKKAWSAVDEADLPEEVRPIAFREAVRLLAPAGAGSKSSRLAGPEQIEDANKTRRSVNGLDTHADTSEDEIYARVVEHTRADRSKLEQLVHLDDDGLRVSLPGLRLGRNNAERTRAVAQILTIVRGFGLEENETPLEVIRTECVRLKVYDSANFSSHVAKLNGFVVSGSGMNRRLRAKSPGIQAFPDLVSALVGDS